MKRIWITWEAHRRSAELARAFEAEYVVVDYGGPRPLRYLRSAAATWRVLAALGRGDVAFVQSPSIFLAWFAAAVKGFRGYVLVVDAHNAVPNYHCSGRFPLESVVRYSTARADRVIVTNDGLVEPIRAMGGRPAVLPDRLPAIERHPMPERFGRSDLPVVTLISSFNWDEPIGTFIEAVKTAGAPFTLYITGRKSKAGELLRHASDRIVFTDYVNDEEFEGLIANSDLLVDLTVDDKVLVCGAYEAVSVGVPLMLVDSDAARKLFTAGVLFADNSVEGFRAALERYFEHSEELAAAMRGFGPVFEEEWARAFRPIAAEIEEAARASAAREGGKP